MSDTTGGDSSNAADSITIEAQAIEHLASIIIAGDNTGNAVGTSLNLLFKSSVFAGQTLHRVV